MVMFVARHIWSAHNFIRGDSNNDRRLFYFEQAELLTCVNNSFSLSIWRFKREGDLGEAQRSRMSACYRHPL